MDFVHSSVLVLVGSFEPPVFSGGLPGGGPGGGGGGG